MSRSRRKARGTAAEKTLDAWQSEFETLYGDLVPGHICWNLDQWAKRLIRRGSRGEHGVDPMHIPLA